MNWFGINKNTHTHTLCIHVWKLQLKGLILQADPDPEINSKAAIRFLGGALLKHPQSYLIVLLHFQTRWLQENVAIVRHLLCRDHSLSSCPILSYCFLLFPHLCIHLLSYTSLVLYFACKLFAARTVSLFCIYTVPSTIGSRSMTRAPRYHHSTITATTLSVVQNQAPKWLIHSPKKSIWELRNPDSLSNIPITQHQFA